MLRPAFSQATWIETDGGSGFKLEATGVVWNRRDVDNTGDEIMPRGQGGARRPATKFPQLQKKLARQSVQKNLQSQRCSLPPRPKKGLP